MSYNVGVQCCRFCRQMMSMKMARDHLCDGSIRQLGWYLEHVVFFYPVVHCHVCGHTLGRFGCGTPGVAAMDIGKYVCYCPPELRLHPFGEALADLVKLDNDVAEFAKLIAGPQADFRKV